MFGSIVVGTDGSGHGRRWRSRQAIELAARSSARLQIVSAYEPVSDPRLRGRADRGARRTSSGR